MILALLGSIDSLLTSLVPTHLRARATSPTGNWWVRESATSLPAWSARFPARGHYGHPGQYQGRRTQPGLRRVALGDLLALVLGIGKIAEPIPLAVLAGILMKVGWDIIDWHFLTRFRHIPREYLLVMLVTLVITIIVDLVTAVALGLIAAGFVRARESKHLELNSVVSVPLLDRTFLPGESEDGEETRPTRTRSCPRWDG